MFLDIVLSVLAALILYQAVAFMILPYVFSLQVHRRGMNAVISSLAALMRMPGLRGDQGKAIVISCLAHLCFLGKRYDEAARWYERLMGLRRVPEVYVPTMHGRYADCCEILGRPDEADRHRKLAVISAQQTPTKMHSVLETGEQLQILGHLEQAMQVYQNALTTGKFWPIQRNQIRNCMAGVAHRLGRPNVVIDTVQDALSDRLAAPYYMHMMQLLGLAYIDQGYLTKAAESIQKFSESAKASRNPEGIAAALADYAILNISRGSLAEAVASATQAVAASTPPSSKCAVVLCQVLTAVGRYPEALEAIDRPKQDQQSLPYQARINKASVLSARARTLNEMARIEEAAIAQKEAMDNVPASTPRATILDLFGGRLDAQAGRFDNARAFVPQIETAISDTRVGRHIRIELLSDLVRLSCLLGDSDACLRYLLQIRALNPYVSDLPRPLYFAASACLKSGDRYRAVELFTEASTVCPEAVYAMHSKNQLGSLV
jgi:tetratricopeptide (TPR) repeat protein